MYWLYSIFLGLGILAAIPFLLLKDTQDGRYTRFLGERLGRLAPIPRAGAIWVHAVSVGETLAIEPLIARLRELYPERPVVLSVTTAAARNLAERRVPANHIFYFPLDLSWILRRTFDAVSPDLILIVETEIWPNFLREAAARQLPVLFINGRVSARSFARYRLLGGLLSRPLACVRGFLMQSETDARRIIELGAPPERVQVVGNLKYDLLPAENLAFRRLMQNELRRAGIRRVLVAGSTMEGEEELVLAAWDALPARENCLLVLAPRHPQRFDTVARRLSAGGLPFSRRSHLERDGLAPGGVLLLDSIGELAAMYQFAQTAFIGGSLVPHGGHNLLEPAYFGVPVTFGPHMQNFAAIAEQFLKAGAAFRTDSAPELARIWQRLLEEEPLRRRAGDAARQLLAAKRGATDRVLEAIARQLDSPAEHSDPCPAISQLPREKLEN